MPHDNGQGHIDTFDESLEISDEDLVKIEDEEGHVYECVVLAVAEFEDTDYALLAPVEQLQDTEGTHLELFIFAYEVDEESMVESFHYVEDEETYKKVEAFFSTLMEQADEE